MMKAVWWALMGVLLLELGVAWSGTAWSQGRFPDGPGKDTLFFECMLCHPPSRITNAKLTADDWEFVLYDMIARGTPLHQKDINVLKKYLIENLAVE